jgi:hypothetical protein
MNRGEIKFCPECGAQGVATREVTPNHIRRQSRVRAHKSENQKGAHLLAFSHNKLRKNPKTPRQPATSAITRNDRAPSNAVVQIVEQPDFLDFFESPPLLCRSKITLHPDISFPSVEPLERRLPWPALSSSPQIQDRLPRGLFSAESSAECLVWRGF